MGCTSSKLNVFENSLAPQMSILGGHGLPPQSLHSLCKNSHLKQYITLSSVWYCQREKHKLNLGLKIMAVHQ
jgi:hypothetical protein